MAAVHGAYGAGEALFGATLCVVEGPVDDARGRAASSATLIPMSRETQVADHWSSAHVVQELGWRPRLPRVSLPGRETSQWRREQFEVRPTHEKAVLVFCEVVHHSVVTATAAGIGLRMLPYGTLPGQEFLPLLAALAGALVACVQCLVWPPDPNDDGLWGHHVPPDTVEEPDHEEDAHEEDAHEEQAYEEQAHPGEVPRSAGSKVLALLFLPVVVLLVVLLLVLAIVAYVAVCIALVVWLLTRRLWPALVVMAALSMAAPQPTFDDLGLILFGTGVSGLVLSAVVLWPLRALFEMPVPDIGKSRRLSRYRRAGERSERSRPRDDGASGRVAGEGDGLRGRSARRPAEREGGRADGREGGVRHPAP